MEIEKIKEVVLNSDFPLYKKTIINDFIENSYKENIEKENIEKLIKEVTNEKNSINIVFSYETLKIYTIFENTKYSNTLIYKFIYLNDKNTWCEVNKNFKNLDTVYLTYLQKKNKNIVFKLLDLILEILENKEDENI